MKISILILAIVCIANIVDAQPAPAPAAAPAGGAKPSNAKITQNIKKANRRTPAEILKDVQESRDDKTNWVVFIKDDGTNQISTKNNA